MAITRTELTVHVGAAFRHGPASRDSLLAYAVGSHARPELITMITNVPDRTYPTVGDLWHDLANSARRA